MLGAYRWNLRTRRARFQRGYAWGDVLLAKLLNRDQGQRALARRASNIKTQMKAMNSLRNHCCYRSLIACAGVVALISIPAPAKEKANKPERYVQINLVSDQPGAALLQDTNLVNAWGVSFSPNSPFWLSDNGTGKSTLLGAVALAGATVMLVKVG